MSSQTKDLSPEQELLDLAVKFAHIGTASFTDTGPFLRSLEHDQIFGVEPGSYFDLNVLYGFIHPDDREFIRGEIEAALAGKRKNFNIEHRIIRRDGVTLWLNAFGRTQSNKKTGRVRLTLCVVDVTERKKLEEDRQMFVATLSHDMRNPLSAARAHAELLLKYLDQIKDRKDSLARIVSNIQRADQLIQDLLDVTRVRVGEKLSLELKTCDLKSEIQDSISEFVTRYGNRFQFVTSGDFFGNWASHDIRRALENLVENAVKYGSADHPITVSLTNQCKTLQLSVKNEGNPIPMDEQKKILEPFRRARQVDGTKAKGWGLGLAVVRAIVEELGGHLHLQSSECMGTVFKIQIPIQ